MRAFRFYKEIDNRWYVDLPEWTGDKSELEMVAGADVMLEFMAEGESEISVTLSETQFEGSDALQFVCAASDIGSGAYYEMEKYKGIYLHLKMWLCNVTLFIYGKFPDKIYVSSFNIK